MNVKLTEEQGVVVKFASTGHNMCILGKAGVGKTTVVESIIKSLTAKGLKCQIVCSSGISCDAYHGMAKTVHSHYGLQTAELPGNLVIDRSLGRKNIYLQIADTKVLIWDVVSMTSQRIFHIVNAIHHIVSNNDLPFGGIQVILVGDFWQLKPVPSPLDPGKSIVSSQLLDKVFPHRFELHKVLRQGDGEDKLKDALDFLREGQCSDKVEKYLQSLARDLDSTDTLPEKIHIYFKKLQVEIHNLDVLAKLPGELTIFKSKDTGNARHLEKTISEVLAVKPGCKVILLYNINDHLKNGYMGEYVGIDEADEERLIVNFPNVGNVAVARRTWYKFDTNGRILGNRTQFPLAPCYAITVHKAQSTTLESVVVHCSQEFVSGQTYVALSRVTREESLQVLGFRRSFLLPPPPELSDFESNKMGTLDEHFGCCNGMHLDENLFECDKECETELEEMDNLVQDNDFTSAASSYFESNSGVVVNLEDVLLCMSDFRDELSKPPPSFSVKTFLEKIINVANEDSYSQSVKSAAKYGVDNLDDFELLASIFWCRIYKLFENYQTENLEQLQMTNKDFTCATSNLQLLFLSQEYRSDLISAYNVEKWVEINDGQRSVGAMLTFHLFQLFGAEVGNRVRKMEECEPVHFNVEEMGPDGRGKIRYVGGWDIRKCLNRARSYVVENKLSQSTNVRLKIHKEMKKINLLENYVISPHEAAHVSTVNPESLRVIESRQYRERGLIHINDNAFMFFLALEQERVDKINIQRLSDLQNDMVDNSIAEAIKNSTLENAFLKLFEPDAEANKVFNNTPTVTEQSKSRVYLL